MKDWNDWVSELQRLTERRLVAKHMSHVRHAYKSGQSAEEVSRWISEVRYEILESPADEAGRATSAGKVIATNLTEAEADEMLDRLYDCQRIWWKQKCSTNQEESLDIASLLSDID